LLAISLQPTPKRFSDFGINMRKSWRAIRATSRKQKSLRKFPWNALKDDTISVQNSQGREESSSLAMSSFPGHQIRHERPKRRSHLELEVIGFGSVTEMPVSKLGMTNNSRR
jgi:hypothetical protein